MNLCMGVLLYTRMGCPPESNPKSLLLFKAGVPNLHDMNPPATRDLIDDNRLEIKLRS
jgi:hypothetical protein